MRSTIEITDLTSFERLVLVIESIVKGSINNLSKNIDNVFEDDLLGKYFECASTHVYSHMRKAQKMNS